jgi:hypothetical protein
MIGAAGEAMKQPVERRLAAISPPMWQATAADGADEKARSNALRRIAAS